MPAPRFYARGPSFGRAFAYIKSEGTAKAKLTADLIHISSAAECHSFLALLL
jgi:hypothetical protein